jgi:hypothetical protein
MRQSCFILIGILILSCTAISAQEVKSVKAGLNISNLPVVKVKVIPDLDPPEVEFITPLIYLGTRYYTDKKELDLIARVTDSSGVSFVSINSNIKVITEQGIFTSRLQLEPGDNPFRLVTMDNKENIKELTFLVNYTPPVVTLADRITSQSTYYGLIVGIDKYMDRNIQDLDNPVKDANKLYNTLIKHYLFSKENILLLPNATRTEIIKSLDELAGLIGSEDNLLIFYAGHGWWDAEANNGYWLPADAEDDNKANWVRNSTLVDYLKEIDSRHTLLITDACFGGSIFKTRSAFGNLEKAFEKLYELPSRKAMTSGTTTEEVPDVSSFTKYLIARLEDNDELYLTSEQLFTSFRHAVINNSNAVPQFGEINNVGDQGGDFIFLKKQSEKQIP